MNNHTHVGQVLEVLPDPYGLKIGCSIDSIAKVESGTTISATPRNQPSVSNCCETAQNKCPQ